MKITRNSICLSIATTFLAIATTSLVAAPVEIVRTNYHGWENSIWMSNGQIEVIVAPAIGRIMRLGFAGAENVLWENRSLDGKTFDGTQKNWVNLGGDKSWPSPEAEWGRYTGNKSWFPPLGFDGLPAAAKIEGATVVLSHPLDPHYGIRTVRRITLDPAKPIMTVRTTYERVQGEPSKVGVWIITQMNEPAGVFVPIPEKSIFPAGFHSFSSPPPPSLKTIAGTPKILSFVRDQKGSFKIGTDAGTLIWVGQGTAMRIDSPRLAGGDYPDKGSSAEVYTNEGEMKYVELEMLGPLRLLKTGDRLDQTNVYTLRRRTETDPQTEAMKLLR